MTWDAFDSVRLADVELAYRVVGDGPGLTVLLHGWPQTGECRRHVVEPLSRDRTVVVPDLRGYGGVSVSAISPPARMVSSRVPRGAGGRSRR